MHTMDARGVGRSAGGQIEQNLKVRIFMVGETAVTRCELTKS